MVKEIWVNMVDIWEYNLTDAIERYEDCLDFSVMSVDEFKEECIKTITYYFENEMLGNEINYNNLVCDTAAVYEMLR